jgi:RND family efflux transporter MFP subunit
VEDSKRYRLEASVPEEYLTRVQAGETVAVQVESGEFQGRVTEIVPAADAASRTFLVKVDLPPSCSCRTGEYGTASFQTGSAQRLAVPSGAVVERGELQGVFVVAQDGRVEYRLVKTGKALGDRMEILSGLAGGEKLATSGTERLRDGVRVEAL